jgi:type VI secretion system secreted protein Hcp
MATDMFIKIDNIRGESQDSAHKNEIEVLGYRWGMSQHGSMHQGKGGGSGRASVSDLVITKYVDAATPNLMSYCCRGKHFESAVLTVRKAGDTPVEHLTIKLEKVMVSGINNGADSGDERQTEEITLNFQRFEVKYTPQDETGKGQASISVKYDIAANNVACAA